MKKKKKKKQQQPLHPETAKKCPRSIIPLPPKKKQKIEANKAPKPLPISMPPLKLPLEYIPVLSSSNSVLEKLTKTIEAKKQEKEIILNQLQCLNNTRTIIMLQDKHHVLFNVYKLTLSKSILFKIHKSRIDELLTGHYGPLKGSKLTGTEQYLIWELTVFKGLRIFLNHVIQSFKTTKEFLGLYCRLSMINKSFTNIYVSRVGIPSLFNFLTQTINSINGYTNFIKSSTYSSNPTKRILTEKKISRINDLLKEAKCEKREESKGKRTQIEFIIANDSYLFTSDYIIKYLLVFEFFKVKWPATYKIQRIDEKKPYQCAVLKRKQKRIVTLLPLIRSNGTVEQVLTTDKLVTVPWSGQTIESMPDYLREVNLTNERIKNRRLYFESLLNNLTSIVFPDVKK